MRYPLLFLLIFTLTTPAHAEPAPAPKPPTVSRETTYYLGPLDEEGYVDYVSALHTTFGDHEVAPDENAYWGISEQLAVCDEFRDRYKLVFETVGRPLPEARPDIITLLFSYVESRGVPEEEAWDIYDACRDRPWSADEYPLTVDWLDSLEPMLDAVTDALQRESYSAPLVTGYRSPTLRGDSYFNAFAHHRIARALSIRTNLHLSEGDLDGVVRNVVALKRFARFQSREPEVNSYFVAWNMDRLAYRALESLLNHADLSRRHIDKLQTGFKNLPKSGSLVTIMSEAERVMVLDMLQQVHRGRVGYWELQVDLTLAGSDEQVAEAAAIIDPHTRLIRDPRFNLAVAMSSINEFWDEKFVTTGDVYQMWATAEELDAQTEAELRDEALFEELWSLGETGIPVEADARQISENAAILFLKPFAPQVSDVIAECVRETTFRVEQIAIACMAYRLNHGEYPRALSDLVPKFLDAVPMDPFAKDAMRYRTDGKGCLIYSVGENGEDDGGRDDRVRGDIVFHLGLETG